MVRSLTRESMRANVVKARADLAHVVITSPIDGLILTPKPQELRGPRPPASSTPKPKPYTLTPEP